MTSISQTAKELDAKYPTHRSEFNIPTFKSLGIKNSKFEPATESTYFCGNSLGLMPKQTRKYLNDELDNWSGKAVEAHFDHPKTCWMNIDFPVVPLLAPLVGGKETEVGVMSTLTSNLNTLLAVFYKPNGKRSKILFEKGAFPSDYYAFLNQIKLHEKDISGGMREFKPEDHLLQLEPEKNSYYLKTSDILKAIEQHHDEIALVCLPGIQYYSGQLFEIKLITNAAKKYGLTVGWDLAHVVGNVPLELHDWGVDFACWCSYKYLNSGPGGIGGYFIHEQYSTNTTLPRLAGWWGNNETERFQMKEVFNPINTALGFRQSNPSVIDVVALHSSLDVFKSVSPTGDMSESRSILREKSIELTKFLEKILTSSKYYLKPEDTFPNTEITKPLFTIITPNDPTQRGAQLSLLFFPLSQISEKNVMEMTFEKIRSSGIIGDERRPNVIRLAPAPLYNTFQEIVYIGEKLNEALDEIAKSW
ncbi:kynureninase [Saccharomycopsis crataegensis]|uniref:Kynureninase n=1 Tax=Saccharomycopsis crataegensis TaxID=43959 RepID=A0AAV5QGC5_9ASCO|nr:kynureninase [Saccharomycopsis crataegensis]